MSQFRPREIAIRLLSQEGFDGEFIEERMERECQVRRPGIAEDRALLQELVLGVVRWRRLLDHWLEEHAPMERQRPWVRAALRVGLYQLMGMDRIPEHAAVHETVAIVQNRLGPKVGGFVNAVLRSAIARKGFRKQERVALQQDQPGVGWSHPDWLVERWQARFPGDAWRSLLEWNNQPARVTARLNRVKAGVDDLLSAWDQEGVRYNPVEADWLGPERMWEIRVPAPVRSLPSFSGGLFYVQDPSTLLAPRWLDVRPGQRVVDVCAAPGGKAMILGEQTGPQGELWASDEVPRRLARVVENAGRMGVSWCRTMDPQSLRESLGRDGADRILLDVPCSNTGVMRRRVESRWRLDPKELERLQRLQLNLLREALGWLRPGGKMVYSTCSLEPEENEQVVESALSGVVGVVCERSRTLFPPADRVDGAFAAVLVRNGQPSVMDRDA